MSFELSTLIPAVQRAAAPPGLFETTYPEATDGDVLGTLMDAFAETTLDGYFPGYALDPSGLLDGDLSLGEQALVVIYASSRLMATELLSRKTHVKYQSGTNVFEQSNSGTFLNDAYKGLQARKRELLSRSSTGSSLDSMGDLFYMKSVYTYADPALVW